MIKKAFPPMWVGGGCQLWLDGADTSSMTLSGSTVTAWQDKSGKGNNATANGSPQLSAGGIITDMVTSPGDNFYINSLSQNITGGLISVSFVATVNQYTGGLSWQYGRILSFGDGTSSDFASDDFTICQNEVNQAISFYTSGGGLVTFGITYGVPFLFTVILDGTNATFYINGTSEYSTTLTKSLNITQIGVGVNITTKTWPNDCLKGVISEVIVFNTALSTNQRKAIEYNLAKKWAVNVPFTIPTSITLVPNGALRPGIIEWKFPTAGIDFAALISGYPADLYPGIVVSDNGSAITQFIIQTTATYDVPVGFTFMNSWQFTKYDSTYVTITTTNTTNDTATGLSTSYNGVYGDTAITAGTKVMFSVKQTVYNGGVEGKAVGIGSSNALYMGNPNATPQVFAFLGGDNQSVGIYDNGVNYALINQVAGNNGTSFQTNNAIIDVAVDNVIGKMWIRVNGGKWKGD